MMSIGRCARCLKDIVAPDDVIVWVEDASYHRACHEAQVASDIAAQVSMRQHAPVVTRSKSGDGNAAA